MDVIDTLVVRLGIDSAQFDAGRKRTSEDLRRTKEEANRTAAEIEASGKQAAQYFTKIRNEVIGLFAVFTAGVGLKDFIRDTTATEAATGRLAHNLGVTTETLSAWQGAAQRAGGTAEGIAGSFQSLTNSFEEIQNTGQSGAMPFMRRLGLSVADLKDLPGTFLKLSGAFHGMDAQTAQYLGRGLGLDPATITFLQTTGPEAIRRLLSQQQALGVITQRDAEAGIALGNAWRDLLQSSTTLGRTILTDVTPALVELLHVLTHIAEWFVAHPHAAEAAFGAMAVAATLLGLAAARLGATIAGALIAEGLGLLPAAFSAASAAGTGLLGTLGLLLARLTLVGAALAAVYEGFHIGGLNEGESAALDKALADAGLPPRKSGVPAPAGLPGGAYPVGAPGVADRNMGAAQQAFLDTLAAPESGGRYDARNPTSGAFGRYQFLPSTWAEVSGKLGIHDTSPVNQDRAAWYYASSAYQRATGRDLERDVVDGGHEAQIANALKSRWPSLPGGTQSRESLRQFSQGLARGARAAIPVAAAGGNTSNSHAETHIGQITVHTAATDAKGIAKGIGGAMEKYSFVPQANTGLA